MHRETIVLMGVNHKTTPVEVRECLALSSGYEEPLAALGRVDGIGEHFLLSTCNRMEVLFTSRRPEETSEGVLDLLFARKVPRAELERYVYHYRDQEAVHHLFLVAASLDSMIVGEAQILGQLKEAYRWAADLGCAGTILNKLLHRAFSAAKRVRTETRIGASAVSISYAAVELAKKIFGRLDDKAVLLVGAGEMAELAAEHLVGQGVRRVVVANRTLERAVQLARRFDGEAVSLAELVEQLEHVDIVISSTGATGLILEKDQVKPVMRRRRNRPLFFIDIAVPRDLDPGINDLANVYLYDIDDLNQVVEMNKAEREQEAVKARRIIDEETIKFGRWLDSMAVTPTIVALRSMAEEICRRELDKTLGKLSHLGPKERKAIEKMAAAITNKFLHQPMLYLKSDAEGQEQGQRIATIHQVFALEKDRPERGDQR